MKKAVLLIAMIFGLMSYAQDSIPTKLYVDGRGPFLYYGGQVTGGGGWVGTATSNLDMATFEILNGGQASFTVIGGTDLFLSGFVDLTPTDTEPTPQEGRLYWDNSENTLKQYNGTAWEALNNAGATTSTGTAINMSGYYQYNMGAASAATTFTTTGAIAGGYAEVLINAASEPTVTGATKIPNTQAFIVSTDMILHIKSFGSTVKYWFTEF